MSTVESMYNRMFIPTTKDEQQEAYSIIAASYDDNYDCAITHGKCFSLLLPHLPAGKIRLLDAGCGTGLLGPYVRKSPRTDDIELIGLDYSKEMMNKAKGKGTFDSFVHADFSGPFDLPGGSVDAFLVSAVFVLNHAPLHVLKNIAHHLSPGGIGVFSVRQELYDEDPHEPERCIAEAGCTLIFKEGGAYGQNGRLTGYYYVIRKG